MVFFFATQRLVMMIICAKLFSNVGLSYGPGKILEHTNENTQTQREREREGERERVKSICPVDIPWRGHKNTFS